MQPSIFSNQLDSGVVPTIMVNTAERKIRLVETVTIPILLVYIAQLSPSWRLLYENNITSLLKYIKSKAHFDEVEGYLLWRFNSFYPPDWEDTAFAIYVLWKNNLLSQEELAPLAPLLWRNTATSYGTGVWVRDDYSAKNELQNHWDPTTAINTLRLHYLLDTPDRLLHPMYRFVNKYCDIDLFSSHSLYYSLPVSAFFAKRLLFDFPKKSSYIRKKLTWFYQSVYNTVKQGTLPATNFEKQLLGIPVVDGGSCLLFHHGKRRNISVWYGSPELFQLTKYIAQKPLAK